MLPLLLAAYATVFTAELVGDKLLYTLTALATRYRPFPMLCGVGVAFMGKMGAAVLLGGLVAHLPAKLVVGLSAATFFTMALVLSFKASGEETSERGPSPHWSRAAVVAFSAVFFSEWGDPGQIAAAVLAGPLSGAAVSLGRRNARHGHESHLGHHRWNPLAEPPSRGNSSLLRGQPPVQSRSAILAPPPRVMNMPDREMTHHEFL